MRAASDALLRTVTGSHSVGFRARVCSTFQSGNDPDGELIDILEGDVASDASSEVRATLDITTTGKARGTGASLWPSFADDLLAPYGNEIYVERGVQIVGQGMEWVGLGYFRIDTPEQNRPADGRIQLACSDRMAGIVDSRLVAPRQFGAAMTYGAVVDDLVLEVYPDALIDWDDSTNSRAIGRAIVALDERYTFLDDLVISTGKVWYWDYRGRLQIKAQPSSDDPVADVMAGRDGVLVSSSRTLTRHGAYNAVVATGQGLDTERPIRAIAFDNNPNSPTYFHGRFGPVPKFHTSPMITDGSSAQAAADTLLLRSIGLPYEVDFQAVPNPALEPWDTIRVRQSTALGWEKHQLRRVTMPLTADRPMTAETKEQTLVLIGRF